MFAKKFWGIFGKFGATAVGKVSTALWPLYSTEQDKHLKKALREARLERQLCIVSEFRGARKTTTAMRCEWRSLLFPGRRVVHIKGYEEYQAHFGLNTEKLPWRYPAQWAIAIVSTALWVGSVALLLRYGVDYFYPDCVVTTFKKLPGFPDNYKLWVVDHPYAVFTTAVTASSLFLQLRPKSYVVDDILKFTAAAGKQPGTMQPSEAQIFLEATRLRAISVPTVFVSSNEGLPCAFLDTAERLHIVSPFATATFGEMIRILNSMKLPGTVTPGLFEHVQSRFPTHYAYSTRWWGMLTSVDFVTLHDSAAKSWCNMVTFDVWRITMTRPPGEPIGVARTTLHRVCVHLDLSCQPLFGALALGLSPRLTDDDASKLAREVNLTIPQDKRMSRGISVAALAKLPRRLCLTVALLKTAPPEVWSPPTEGEEEDEATEEERSFIGRVRDRLTRCEDKTGPGKEAWSVEVCGGKDKKQRYTEIRRLLCTTNEEARALKWEVPTPQDL
eukprot:TRINITY_DN3076_c1_g1_i11.p1 TRINITY_DN3076_c1_g1~~TRINITY_DN3076_c1_g1_i11.p1  ORF type:complete len:501 (+),score=117.73 TRINITY_DN3076_c1_g1_i11:51-1553(+)